jgi:hypothetical protein
LDAIPPNVLSMTGHVRGSANLWLSGDPDKGDVLVFHSRVIVFYNKAAISAHPILIIDEETKISDTTKRIYIILWRRITVGRTDYLQETNVARDTFDRIGGDFPGGCDPAHCYINDGICTAIAGFYKRR